MGMDAIIEPTRKIPIIEETDICVLGGSCTGVFAAVRAARLGAKVVIVEKQNSFGGVAGSGLVNVWHSLMDTEYRKQIIAGLTLETVERLKKRDAAQPVENNPDIGFRLNTEELKIELDELITEAKVKPYLHTLFAAPYMYEGRLDAVIVENKSGRQAIKAKVFIDATGDGDLCARAGYPCYTPEKLQPPTCCAKLFGTDALKGFDLQQAIHDYREEFGLKEDWGWNTAVPDLPGISMHAETHVFDVNCAEAADLTYGEMEGRRQVRAIMDIIRKYGPPDNKIALAALPSYIGIRETRHVKCMYRLTEDDVLSGRNFDDSIANGSYRVDVHLDDQAGIIFRYLDGTEIFSRRGYKKEIRRWREETTINPTCYHIPYRSMVPVNAGNVIACGRMIDADRGAYGAVRVMVNMNQTGEAAGVAAYIALNTNKSVADVDVQTLRKTLKDGGSVII